MERFCDKCGSLVSGDVKFCPTCGSQMQGAVDLGKNTADIMPQGQMVQMQQPMQPVQPNYGYNSNQSMGYGAPQYGQPYGQNVPAGQMTTGQWIGTILLCTCFGLISFILTAVWAFSDSTPEPKRGFCKGYFFVQLILGALSVLVWLIFVAFIGANFESILDFLFDGYYYW